MVKKKIIIVILLYCLIVTLIFLIYQFFFINPRSHVGKDKKSFSHFGVGQAFSFPNLTFNSIFSSNHSWVNRLSKDKTITLITTGDIIPARTVNFKMTTYNNFKYPFEKTADFLKSSDLTLINLESPLIKNCPLTNQGMIFCGSQRFIEGLLFADIDVVNLANNHTLNWGIEGISQTIELLEQNGITTCGFPINKIAIKEVKGIKIGFLGWNLLEKFNENEILAVIKQAKKEVNLLIVSLHWGREYSSSPADWQIKLAHKIIDSGTDLIIGNHPHWIQPVEIYQDKLIIYAQGNFIFDQEWSKETKTGIVAKHTFYGNKLVDSQFFPIFINDYSQPEFLEEERKEQVLEKLRTISQELIRN